jgi:hypothetical protein
LQNDYSTDILTYALSSQEKSQYYEDQEIIKAVQDSMAEWRIRKARNRYLTLTHRMTFQLKFVLIILFLKFSIKTKARNECRVLRRARMF